MPKSKKKQKKVVLTYQELLAHFESLASTSVSDRATFLEQTRVKIIEPSIEYDSNDKWQANPDHKARTCSALEWALIQNHSILALLAQENPECFIHQISELYPLQKKPYLHIAAMNGNLKCVRAFLKNDSNPNHLDGYKVDAASTAIAYGHIEVACEIIAHPHYQCVQDEVISPLSVAAALCGDKDFERIKKSIQAKGVDAPPNIPLEYHPSLFAIMNPHDPDRRYNYPHSVQDKKILDMMDRENNSAPRANQITAFTDSNEATVIYIRLCQHYLCLTYPIGDPTEQFLQQKLRNWIGVYRYVWNHKDTKPFREALNIAEQQIFGCHLTEQLYEEWFKNIPKDIFRGEINHQIHVLMSKENDTKQRVYSTSNDYTKQDTEELLQGIWKAIRIKTSLIQRHATLYKKLELKGYFLNAYKTFCHEFLNDTYTVEHPPKTYINQARDFNNEAIKRIIRFSVEQESGFGYRQQIYNTLKPLGMFFLLLAKSNTNNAFQVAPPIRVNLRALLNQIKHSDPDCSLMQHALEHLGIYHVTLILSLEYQQQITTFVDDFCGKQYGITHHQAEALYSIMAKYLLAQCPEREQIEAAMHKINPSYHPHPQYQEGSPDSYIDHITLDKNKKKSKTKVATKAKSIPSNKIQTTKVESTPQETAIITSQKITSTALPPEQDPITTTHVATTEQVKPGTKKMRNKTRRRREAAQRRAHQDKETELDELTNQISALELSEEASRVKTMDHQAWLTWQFNHTHFQPPQAKNVLSVDDTELTHTHSLTK